MVYGRKQSSRDRLKEITASIEDGIKELFQSESYAQYLQTMSRFHHYSVNNQVLIHMQKPDATLVAGFNKWKNQFGRNVIKGEHGIKIIAPTPFKKKIEQEKLTRIRSFPCWMRRENHYGGKDHPDSHVQAGDGVRRFADRGQAVASAGP